MAMASSKDSSLKQPDIQENNRPNSILEDIENRSPIEDAEINVSHEEFGNGTLTSLKDSSGNQRIAPLQENTSRNANSNISLLQKIENRSPLDHAQIHVPHEGVGDSQMASPKDLPKKKNTNPNSILDEEKSSIDAAEIHAIHEEISELAKNYQDVIVDINNGCSDLNEEIGPLMVQRSSSATLYLGKEATTLLGSLKTLGDKIFKEKDNYNNIEKNLEKATFDMGRSSQQLESMTENLEHHLETLQTVMDYCSKFSEKCSIERTPTPLENNSSNTSSDISSFKCTDIVTSSPFSSFNKIDEESKEESESY